MNSDEFLFEKSNDRALVLLLKMLLAIIYLLIGRQVGMYIDEGDEETCKALSDAREHFGQRTIKGVQLLFIQSFLFESDSILPMDTFQQMKHLTFMNFEDHSISNYLLILKRYELFTFIFTMR